MDSIGDYIVILFFALSFLSSLLKKKKKNINTESSEPQRNSVANEVIRQRQPHKNALDVFLDAIESEQKNDKEEQLSEVDLFFEEAMKNSAKENSSEKIAVENLSDNYNEQNSDAEPENTEHRSENLMQTYSESIISSKEKYKNKKTIELKSLLQNKNSIKQFIIMNEILGKPKALQK